MTANGLNHWVSSPYCFCRGLPWLVLSGLPATPRALSGGWGWEEWAILAAALMALALFLFLLFCLLCLLCPKGLCCGRRSACCAHGKDEKKKMGLSSAQGVEMSSFGGSDDSTLTAVDLKLPRAWMDASKGDLTTDERGDLGLTLGSFGNQKTWGRNGQGSGGFVNRGANFGRSEFSGNLRSGGMDDDFLDGSAEDSAKLDYYRNQSAATLMTPNGGGNARDAINEWQRSSRTETRRLVESSHTRHSNMEDARSKASHAMDKGSDGNTDRELDMSYSTLHDSTKRESAAALTSSNDMALVKASNSGSVSTVATSGGSGTPVMQCYTVTKKTTTTTYGDEEGDEGPQSLRIAWVEKETYRLWAETAVVTTTEKKWREGMNEVGEITVAASASAGELLPSIGAPARVVNDVSNVRTVKSLTNVEGGASNVVRRYEFQQTSDNVDTVL